MDIMDIMDSKNTTGFPVVFLVIRFLQGYA